jgi:hypothetical protein
MRSLVDLPNSVLDGRDARMPKMEITAVVAFASSGPARVVLTGDSTVVAALAVERLSPRRCVPLDNVMISRSRDGRPAGLRLVFGGRRCLAAQA